ncbi:MAG TPA: hypothetical protein DCR40_17505 [Prolixibacteraceae bacterium]|nr:hypothetical protein [Prolixibacteraceae bacterium]
MEAFALYLFKSSVWLTGFALVYVLFLRNERFFTLNRIYLVSGILGSILFPLFTWHYTVLMPVVPTSEVFEPQVRGIVEVSEPFLTQNVLLLLLYISGILFLVFRILRQTFPIFRIIRKSETHQYRSAKLIRTDAYPASFSFFSFVFVNPSISDTEANEIVNHELEHIRQHHWIDLLLFEILRTVQWFNPAIWMYGHLIRQNHEYLADERALQCTTNPAIYRAALLNQMFGGPVISLANSFNYSLNKKRFNMMKQTISSPIRKFKLLLILPLIAGVFYAFASPEYKFIQPEEHSTNLNQDEKTVKGKVTDESGKPLKSATIIISGTTIGTITDHEGNFALKVTDDSPIMISYVGFESVKVNPDFEKEMQITMKGATISIKMDNQSPAAAKKEPLDIMKSNALIIVDGKETTKAEMEKINPNNIDRIDVLKNGTSVEKYGEKGKDGVVLITMKKGEFIDGKSNVTNLTGNFALNSMRDTTPESSGLHLSAKEIRGEYKDGTTILKADTFKMDFAKTNSLILIDGKKSTKAEVNQLNPGKIESISVLKDESATRLYGEKGKNGVILITMKKGETAMKNEKVEVKVTGYGDGTAAKQSGQTNSGVQIRSAGTSNNESNPLIVIDGVISENQDMSKIDPETIESVNVIKNEEAAEKYGKKAKGVIEITTKKSGDVFTMVEEMPEFPGGAEAINPFIKANLQYPEKAVETGITGKVFVNFMISKTGKVENVKVTKSLHPLLDAEAVRVIKLMPDWKPGTQNGEKVDVKFNLPVYFQNPNFKQKEN